MSKAEIIQQLETLSADDLDEVLERASVLRNAQDAEELTSYEREILEKRMREFSRENDKGEPWSVVRTRVMAKLKK